MPISIYIVSPYICVQYITVTEMFYASENIIDITLLNSTTIAPSCSCLAVVAEDVIEWFVYKQHHLFVHLHFHIARNTVSCILRYICCHAMRHLVNTDCPCFEGCMLLKKAVRQRCTHNLLRNTTYAYNSVTWALGNMSAVKQHIPQWKKKKKKLPNTHDSQTKCMHKLLQRQSNCKKSY